MYLEATLDEVIHTVTGRCIDDALPRHARSVSLQARPDLTCIQPPYWDLLFSCSNTRFVLIVAANGMPYTVSRVVSPRIRRAKGGYAG